MSIKKNIEVLWNSPESDDANEDKKIRVAAYCRISPCSNDENINSLENQISHYTRYIRDNKGYSMVGVYYDKNVSGATIDKRPGLKRLLRHCEEQRIDMVITKSISRLSRNSKDLLEMVDRLSSLGITIVFEKENIDTSKTKNKFYLTALAAIYQEEIRTVSDNIKWGYEKRILKGMPMFTEIFGYDITPNTARSAVTINETEAAVIREVFELFISGVSMSRIAKMLMERGIKSKRGKEAWSASEIGRILRNQTYTGDKVTHKHVSDFISKSHKKNIGQTKQFLIEHSHQAIISKETFQKAQKILNKKRSKKSIAKQRFPLSNRILCGLCGAVYHKNDKSDQIYWICNRRKVSRALCASNMIKESKIVEMMKRAFSGRYDFANPFVLKEILHDLESMNQNDHFEYHRLSLISRLEIAREIGKTAEGEEQAEKIESIEKEIKEFEELTTKLEDDREYRDSAIMWMQTIKTLDEFMAGINSTYIRAWIISIKIFSAEDYIVRWLDSTETKMGNCDSYRSSIEAHSKEFHEIVSSKVMGVSDLDSGLEKTKTLIEDADKYTRQDAANGKEENVELQRNVSVIEPNLKLPTAKLVSREKAYDNRFKLDNEINAPDGVRERIGIYARISTHLSGQLGSLEAQVAHYTYSTLKNPKYQLAQMYIEKGVSGTKAEKRPEFMRMIEDCKAGKLDRIITKSISRFARNTVDALVYVRMLKSLKPAVYITFEKEGIDTAENDGETLFVVYSGLAQEESRSLAESVAWGKRALAKRGIYRTSMRTYGYELGENRSWHVNPKEAKVVKWIYDAYLQGKSINQIKTELTDKEVETYGGKKEWGRTSVLQILKNPAYTGDLLFQKSYVSDPITGSRIMNKGEREQYLIEGHHCAIISHETWNKVQDRVEKRSAIGRTGGNKNPKKHTRQEFFKKFSCSECGSHLIHMPEYRIGENGVHYWRCNEANKNKHLLGCSARSFREECIEHTFMAMLQEMKYSHNLKDDVEQAAAMNMLTDKEREKIKLLESEMQRLYQELYSVVEEGKKIGEDTEIIQELADSIMSIQSQINDFNAKQERAESILKELKWLQKELRKLEDFDPEKERIPFRADIFSRIVENGVVHPDGKIDYNLKLGISWTAKGNEKRVRRLPMKSKEMKLK